MCSGAAEAQGLADYLLHSASSEEELDVPLLLAPAPFLRASLQHLQPQVGHEQPDPCLSADTSTVQVLAAAPGESTREFRFELRSLLPPWVLQRVLRTLQRQHEGPVQVRQLVHSCRSSELSRAFAGGTGHRRKDGLVQPETGLLQQLCCQPAAEQQRLVSLRAC